MNNVDDKSQDKIIYLNNKIFEEKMKKYSEQISKSNYVYYKERVRNIKDIEKLEDVNEIKEIVDDNKSNYNENKKKTNAYKNEISFKLKGLKAIALKTFLILLVLYISPFIANILVDLGINVFISLFIIIFLVYSSIMYITTR